MSELSCDLSMEQIRDLCRIWRELNAIRAKDGAPEGVTTDYWAELCDSLNTIIVQHTGQGAWLHPLLYNPKDPMR